jgi:hypothetical protein
LPFGLMGFAMRDYGSLPRFRDYDFDRHLGEAFSGMAGAGEVTVRAVGGLDAFRVGDVVMFHQIRNVFLRWTRRTAGINRHAAACQARERQGVTAIANGLTRRPYSHQAAPTKASRSRPASSGWGQDAEAGSPLVDPLPHSAACLLELRFGEVALQIVQTFQFLFLAAIRPILLQRCVHLVCAIRRRHALK